MKTHIVLAHPESNSFNGHLASVTQASLQARGYDTMLSDLQAMGFDPREGAAHYQNRKDPDRFHAQTEQRFNADAGHLPDMVASEVENLMGSEWREPG